MDGSDQVAVRQAKLDQMRENGYDPFRVNWDQTHTSEEAKPNPGFFFVRNKKCRVSRCHCVFAPRPISTLFLCSEGHE